MTAPTSLRVALRVAALELRAAFRDRQAVLYGVLLPLGLYPALLWAALQVGLVVRGREESLEVAVALAAEAAFPVDAAKLARALEDPSRNEARGEGAAAETDAAPRPRPVRVLAPKLGLDEAAARALVARTAASHAAAREAEATADAVLWFPVDGDGPRLFHDTTRRASKVARERVERRLAAWSEELREDAAAALDLRPEALQPLVLEEANVAGEEDMGAFVISMLLPMMLVVMTVFGAFFPAIDLTAGEVERGTIETTLLLPVPRAAVHLGKVFAVTVSALAACALNLAAIGLSAGQLLAQLGPSGVRVDLPVRALLAVSPLAAAFALFVAAVLVAVASLATSFKEGQALLGPVQIVFFLPAVAGTIPGLVLDERTALIPVVNVVLAFRDLLRGQFAPLPLAITALVLVVFAVLATLLSLRLLSREPLPVAGGRRASLATLFTRLRAPGGTR